MAWVFVAQRKKMCISGPTPFNPKGQLNLEGKEKDDFFSVRLLPAYGSQKDIKPMRDQIVRVKRYEKVPLILVGNKVDLEPEREVMSSEGRALAQEWGCPFMETSAKSKSMVDELFAEIVRQMNYSSLPEKQDQCCTTCVVQ
ncbi:ras-related protein Rap-2c [Phyllostomus discolor]|uniref:Ras-related protein Rap-2c n=1 Tax=Phyllostomus discolor TaxID=89673 RepID=A0A7E6CYY1_9CHIR|nr:ras-related protein Rap-2c [Phyllostomus discolor]